jgi:hypothetical protein
MKSLLTTTACALLVSGCATLYGGPSAKEMDAAIAAIRAECNAKWRAPEFDIIRDKVELSPTTQGASLSFNDRYATEAERPVVAKFGALLDYCQGQVANIVYVSHPTLGMSSIDQTNAEVAELVNLYNKQISWGEFNNRRHMIINRRAQVAAANAQRQYDAEMERSRQYREAVRRSLEPPPAPKRSTTQCRDQFGTLVCETTED